jgi:adenylylsulfate kinase
VRGLPAEKAYFCLPEFFPLLMEKNIHPIFDQILQRADKEKLLGQRSKVVWFTGLSGSGKSTLARQLESRLHEKGFYTQLLDGDNLRSGIHKNLGFSEEDRKENIRRTAELAKLFLQAGAITLCSFVSPTHEIRSQVREIVGEADFLEVYVKCSFEACAKRDVKGLYKKALNGEIKNFTGLDAPFEEPEHPWLLIDTEALTVEAAVDMLEEKLLDLIRRD